MRRIAERYRSDIDGLRAVAVSVVVGYHAFPRLIPGGFIGVDMFFVISGYLITGIIFEQMTRGDFSIAKFYARRIKRIFPALILVVIVTFAIGWYVLPPREYQSLGTNIAGAAAFMQNLVLLGQVGYFDITADKKPLLHLWSLGIEEQYYIVWPIVLLAIRRMGLSAVGTVCVLIAASFCYGLVALQQSADLAFYLPFTRAWELFAGALLAVGVLAPAEKIPAWTARHTPAVLQDIARATRLWRSERPIDDIGAILAVLLIAYALWRFDSKTPYPGYDALFPVIAAALLILSSGAWINRRILSYGPLVLIGLISYPLYLWHFPLIAYAKVLFVDAVPKATMAGIVALSVVLAYLTYRLVERPIRFGAPRPYKVGMLLAGMGVVGAVGVVTDRTGGLEMRIPKPVRAFMLTGEETSVHWRRGKCLLLPDQGEAEFAPECGGDGRRPLLFVWGDSYAAAFYAGLNALSSSAGYGVAEYTASACPPLIGYVHPERAHCKAINDFVLGQVKALRPEAVILHSTWSYSPAEIENGLRETVSSLRALNIRKIVLLGPVPTWKGSGLAANVLDYYYDGAAHVLLPERTKYRLNDVWSAALDQFMAERAERIGIEYIAPQRIMCNQDGCLARVGKDGADLTAFDGGHMTMAGSMYLARAILPRLLDDPQHGEGNQGDRP